MSKKNNIIDLRCFVYFNMEHQKFYAFCIDLNLASQADSLDSVLDKVRDNISMYLESQLEYNKEKNITAFPFRKSPLSIRFNYFIGFLVARVIQNIQKFVGSFNVDSKELEIGLAK